MSKLFILCLEPKRAAIGETPKAIQFRTPTQPPSQPPGVSKTGCPALTSGSTVAPQPTPQPTPRKSRHNRDSATNLTVDVQPSTRSKSSSPTMSKAKFAEPGKIRCRRYLSSSSSLSSFYFANIPQKQTILVIAMQYDGRPCAPRAMLAVNIIAVCRCS